MSKINIDAQLVKRTEEKMIELSNGCICCTLREDLLNQLVEIGKSKTCDNIVIESTGIAEPLHIAETFAYAEQTPIDSNDPNNKSTLSGLIKLDTMITVVDLETFLHHYNSSDVPDSSLCSTKNNENDSNGNGNNITTSTTSTTTSTSTSTTIPPEERTLSNLLIDQIQFANIIILNKCDLVSKQQCSDIKGIIKDLNPHAKILLSSYGNNLPIKKLINTNLFSYENAEKHTEWFATEWGITSPLPETVEYGITSITFQTHSRPFHPNRLYNFYHKYKLLLNSFIKNKDENNTEGKESINQTSSQSQQKQFKLLRSKGFIWLPWNFQRYYLLHHTGGSLAIQEKDTWWIVKDPEQRPNNIEFENEIGYLLTGDKAVKYGDRGNTLILIGQHATKEKWNEITEELNNCLFNDDEMNQMNGNEESKEWIEQWKNPFNLIPNFGNNQSHNSENYEEENEEENDDSEEGDEDEDDDEEEEENDDNDDNEIEEEEEVSEKDDQVDQKKRLHSNIEDTNSIKQTKRNVKTKK